MGEPFTLTRQQVRELDRRAMDEYGLPGIVLMENAGRGCAELLMRLNPEKKPTVILCGPGNNGGDGFVMARHLDNHGWPVGVVISLLATSPKGDAVVNFRCLYAGEIPLFEFPSGNSVYPHRGGGWPLNGVLEADPTNWVVDALFGTGLSRPLEKPYPELAGILNACGNPVLAIDIPSGLDCDTGEPLGPTVRATLTATFVAPKRGFLNPKSQEWTGEVHVIDIGAPRKLVEEYKK